MAGNKHNCSPIDIHSYHIYVYIYMHSKNTHMFFVIYIEALTFGQPYRMSLQLEMPDSPTNRELGMFMIKTTCFSQDGEQVASSARSVSCTHTHSAPARLHAIK